MARKWIVRVMANRWRGPNQPAPAYGVEVASPLMAFPDALEAFDHWNEMRSNTISHEGRDIHVDLVVLEPVS